MLKKHMCSLYTHAQKVYIVTPNIQNRWGSRHIQSWRLFNLKPPPISPLILPFWNSLSINPPSLSSPPYWTPLPTLSVSVQQSLPLVPLTSTTGLKNPTASTQSKFDGPRGLVVGFSTKTAKLVRASMMSSNNRWCYPRQQRRYRNSLVH